AANLQEAVGPASPPVGVQLGNTGGGASPGTPANEVYVGTFTVTVGTAPTTFSVGALNDPTFGGGGVTLTLADTDLDLAQTSAGTTIAGLSGAAENLNTFTVAPG
ncbi:MAG TPA: hypothetical protein VG269_21555, partial [Tepidisphaeraceae bacterium]|nr:hypothetical protein [Tepidisphaeraceae bacterium]